MTSANSRLPPLDIPWPLSEPDGPPPPRTAWVQERPLIFVGGWEPLAFRRRSGYAWTDEGEYLAKHEFSPAALDQFVNLGCTLIVIPFAKAPGLLPATAELDLYRTIVHNAHQRGLRVGTYLRLDNVIPDVMADQYPDLPGWFAKGMYGHTPVYHPQQAFRKRVCLLHPAVVAAVETTIRSAIEDAGADLLALDGYSVTNVPWSVCRCERCVGWYRHWLQAKYPDPDERERVFGFRQFDRAEIPEFTPGAPLASVVNAPEIRAWYEHLWDKNLAFTRHVRRFVRRLSEAVAISINPIWTHTFHLYRYYGVDAERLLPWVDMIWTEDQLHASSRDGKTHLHHSLFKTAREHNLPVGCYHHETVEAKLSASLALATAANGGNPSCLGFTFRFLPHFSLGGETKQRYARWAQANWNLIGNTRPDAEIALLRHRPSLAWNGLAPWHAVWAMTQFLSRQPVPWRLFHEIDPALLRQIKTLIAPDAESISDAELAVLRQWVENGGQLLVTRRTASHDEHRRRRPRLPILDWVPAGRVINDRLGPHDWCQWMNDDAVRMAEPGAEEQPPQSALSFRPIVAPLGHGRLGVWPTLSVPFTHSATTDVIPSRDCVPPDHSAALGRFLRKLHGAWEMEVLPAGGVLVETARQPATGARLIQVVRLDGGKAGAAVTIRLRDPISGAVRVLSPDAPPPQFVQHGTTMTVKNLQQFAVIRFEPSVRAG